MNKDRLSKVLLAPHLSEKATRLADSMRCHVFKIAPDATKSEVRNAAEWLFEVEVENVNIVNMRGKKKGQKGRRPGRRKDWKKAYVTLAEGHDIQLGGND